MSHLALLNDFYKTAWIDGDIAAIDRYFTARTEAHGMMGEGEVGPEDFKVLIPAFRAGIRDITVRYNRVVEMGDWLFAHVTAEALTANGLDPVRASGMCMMRVENGLVAEAYNSFDFLSFFEQMGQLPNEALALLLSGETIG